MSNLKQKCAETNRLEKMRNRKMRAWRKRNKRRFRTDRGADPHPEGEESKEE